MISGLFLTSALTVSAPALAAGDGTFNPLEFASGASFWTIVIFALALVPMWKFVFGPITKALDERDKKVDDAIAAAEASRKAAEEQVEATKRELEQAQREARQKVEEAVARARVQADLQLAEAKAEADRQREQARAEIEAMKQSALEEIRREVVDLSIQAAGHILRTDLNDAGHRKMVGEFVAGVGGRA